MCQSVWTIIGVMGNRTMIWTVMGTRTVVWTVMVWTRTVMNLMRTTTVSMMNLVMRAGTVGSNWTT